MARKLAQGKQPARAAQPKPPFILLAALGALALIIAGVVLLGGNGGRAGSGAARVTVEPEKIDFGKVQVETPVTARFVVKNEGDGDLQILGQPQVRLVEGC